MEKTTGRSSLLREGNYPPKEIKDISYLYPASGLRLWLFWVWRNLRETLVIRECPGVIIIFSLG